MAKLREERVHGGPERRRWARAASDLAITVALDDSVHEARVRDISRAGVCFYLDRAIPPMTVLRIALELEVDGRKRRLTGLGAVVRCERISPALSHYEIALFVHDMSESDRLAIEAHVRSRVAV
jgi:hypothetical protein